MGRGGRRSWGVQAVTLRRRHGERRLHRGMTKEGHSLVRQAMGPPTGVEARADPQRAD